MCSCCGQALIRKLVSGVYGFMPLGWRSVRKIEDIVRQEMDAAGGQEIQYVCSTAGRIVAGNPADGMLMARDFWRLKDRNGREFCLGPTTRRNLYRYRSQRHFFLSSASDEIFIRSRQSTGGMKQDLALD